MTSQLANEDGSEVSAFGEQVAASENLDRLRKRHRARHTKSRRGCFPCKQRRVKVLENTDQESPIWRYAMVILAHFYVLNTLIDTWFLHRSFEGEIFKIRELLRGLGDVQLTNLMEWPVQAVRP